MPLDAKWGDDYCIRFGEKIRVLWFIPTFALIHVLLSLCPSQSRPRDQLEEAGWRAAVESWLGDGGGSAAPVQGPVWRQRHLPVWGSELEGEGLPPRSCFCRGYGVCTFIKRRLYTVSRWADEQVHGVHQHLLTPSVCHVSCFFQQPLISLIYSISRMGGAHQQHGERPPQWLHHVLRGQWQTSTTNPLAEERSPGNVIINLCRPAVILDAQCFLAFSVRSCVLLRAQPTFFFKQSQSSARKLALWVHIMSGKSTCCCWVGASTDNCHPPWQIP